MFAVDHVGSRGQKRRKRLKNRVWFTPATRDWEGEVSINGGRDSASNDFLKTK